MRIDLNQTGALVIHDLLDSGTIYNGDYYWIPTRPKATSEKTYKSCRRREELTEVGTPVKTKNPSNGA